MTVNTAINPVRREAGKIAAILSANETVVSFVAEHSETELKAKKGASEMAMLIQNTLSDEQYNAIPIIGSEKPEGYKGNAIFDKYKVEYKDANNNKRYKDGSFINDLADQFAYGAAIQSELDKIAKAEAKDADADERYLTMSEDAREAEKEELAEKKKAYRKLFRKSVGLLQKLDATNELAGVGVRFMKGPDGKPTKAVLCLRVFDKTNEDNFERMNVTEFLRHDPYKAAANGGTYAEFIKTGKKNTGGGEGETEKSKGGFDMPKDAEIGLDHAVTLFNWLRSDAGLSAMIAAVAKEKERFLMPLADLEGTLAEFNVRYKTDIATMQAERDKAAKAEREAKAKAANG